MRFGNMIKLGPLGTIIIIARILRSVWIGNYSTYYYNYCWNIVINDLNYCDPWYLCELGNIIIIIIIHNKCGLGTIIHIVFHDNCVNWELS